MHMAHSPPFVIKKTKNKTTLFILTMTNVSIKALVEASTSLYHSEQSQFYMVCVFI